MLELIGKSGPYSWFNARHVSKRTTYLKTEEIVLV